MCCRAGARLSLTLLNSTELHAKAPEGEVVAPGDLWCVHIQADAIHFR
jgi:hypothetical protein